VAYLVANADTVAYKCVFRVSIEIHGDRSALVSTMQADPAAEQSWEQWDPGVSLVHPQNGKLTIRRNLSLQPREVAVIRLTPQGTQL
jgi:hypothetical protein